jgi:hypothetical protein
VKDILSYEKTRQASSLQQMMLLRTWVGKRKKYPPKKNKGNYLSN